MGARSRHVVNKAVAYAMPAVIFAAMGYATWVFCAVISVNYLLREQHRKGTATCLITLYIIFFLPLLSAYLRVFYTINVDPSYIPLGPKLTKQEEADEKRGDDSEGRRASHRSSWIPLQQSSANPADPSIAHRSEAPQETPHVPNPSSASQRPEVRSSNVASIPRPSAQSPQLEQQSRDNMNPLALPPEGRWYGGGARPVSFLQSEVPKNLSEFYKLDAFVCENDGLPKWCSNCNCWKPDRSHHCSEVGRCVMKMDHFCPWVGGVVGETTFKFFYQVVVYGAIYCTYVMVATAVLLKNHSKENGQFPGTWAALIAVTTLFGLFSASMAITTTQLIWRNTTTIDSLSAATKVYQIALYDPLGMVNRDSALLQPQHQEQGGTEASPQQQLPPSPHSISRHGQIYYSQNPGLAYTFNRVTFPYDDPAYLDAANQSDALHVPRTFVIAKTQPGENPWRSPSIVENFTDVLGHRFWEWWIPFGRSPCSRHHINKNYDDVEKGGGGHTTGWYKWNEELLARLRKECGILAPWEVERVGRERTTANNPRNRENRNRGEGKRARRTGKGQENQTEGGKKSKTKKEKKNRRKRSGADSSTST